MTRIKICGLSRGIDIDYVNKVLPDYIGFVFAKSRRQVGLGVAKILKERLNPNIQGVGVFVNEEMGQIVRACEEGIIDIVQLHGDEEEDFIKRLRTYVPNKIIKAVRVKTIEDISRANEYSSDYLLLDAYEKGQYGGSGKTFDWSVVDVIEKPFFLAGGINVTNILSANEKCRPFCIDVSSGVETDGYKDEKKIIDIVTKIRSV